MKLTVSNKGIEHINSPEAYEKLLFDSMRGDATNFTHWDEVALSWKFVDTISNAWENTKDESFPNYEAGSQVHLHPMNSWQKMDIFGGKSRKTKIM